MSMSFSGGHVGIQDEPHVPRRERGQFPLVKVGLTTVFVPEGLQHVAGG